MQLPVCQTPPLCLNTSQNRTMQHRVALYWPLFLWCAGSSTECLGSSPEAGSPATAGRPCLMRASSCTSSPRGQTCNCNWPDCFIVIRPLIDARLPSARLLYANRWKLFSALCNSQNVNPEHCSAHIRLRYLQTSLDTLNLYVAASSARQASVDDRPMKRSQS